MSLKPILLKNLVVWQPRRFRIYTDMLKKNKSKLHSKNFEKTNQLLELKPESIKDFRGRYLTTY